MESTGIPGEIQVSADSYERLKGAFALKPRGSLDIKGKGQMTTWLLAGRLPNEADEPSS